MKSRRIVHEWRGTVRDYRSRAGRLALALIALVGTTSWYVFAGSRSAIALAWCSASLALLTGLVPVVIWSPTWAVPVQVAMEVTLLVGWVQLTGSVFNPLQWLLPLLALLHGSIDGRRTAITSVALGLSGLSVIAALETSAILTYAPALETATDASTLRRAVSVVAVASASAVALFITPRVLGERRRNPGPRNALAGSGTARAAGTLLDRDYAVHEVIGRGGMGTVYAATRRNDGRRVAIKVLHRQRADSTDAVERFRREAVAISRLVESRVPRVLGFVESKEEPSYLVMEHLTGSDLSAVLAAGPAFSPLLVANLLDQVAEVLAAAHALGIVHRDIKPKNIFLVGGRQAQLDIRLLDFGLCRFQEPEGAPNSTTLGAIGSPGYFAPEQICSDYGPIGPHTDIFAAGVVAYRALTGVDAFAARQPAEAAYEALEHNPQKPSRLVRGLPLALDTVFERALAKRPSGRQSSAIDLARDFRAALEIGQHAVPAISDPSRDTRLLVTLTRA